ncbi:hypothetical protein NBH00_07850 [Paraconexibacter antarcticus]|uniref:ABC transporter permease n=1 Tax=Paraconexibacter antarcticus TaxID=2949664 RepID=A0ABY5DZ08_9ACTN|nr:hypothetical protein [Paraconexibacter antarcticus]UTI66107.1 hypothetical protein NBH00_07850 [Paraconexibacter antarcticus]
MTPAVRAAVAAVVLALLGAAYVGSYLAAQADPAPHHVAVRVSGSPARTRAALLALRRTTPGAFDAVAAPSGAAARAAVLGGEASGALLLRTPPVLLVAPARGASTARALGRRLPKAAGVKGVVRVAVLRPLPRRDPQGSALGLTLLPLAVIGVLITLVLAALAPDLTVRARVVVVGGFALLSGTAAGLVATVGLDVLPTPPVTTCLVLAALVAAIALPTLTVIAAIGPIGVLAGFVTFLVVGNVAAGATVDTALMPQPWRAVGPLLPPGAATDLLRGLAPHDPTGTGRPLLVLGAFVAAGLAGTLALGDRRPAPQGDPEGPTSDMGPSGELT